jgi:hypothetical protein
MANIGTADFKNRCVLKRLRHSQDLANGPTKPSKIGVEGPLKAL